MIRLPALACGLVAAVFLCAAPALAQQEGQTLVLHGTDGQQQTISVADLADLPHERITMEIHGETHVYEGPLLFEVLNRVGAPATEAMHGLEFAKVVRIVAEDGYQVVIGLGEADPGIRPNRIILAVAADGAPLNEGTGPFRVIIEDDIRPARSARQVVRIEVIDLADATVTRQGGHAH